MTVVLILGIYFVVGVTTGMFFFRSTEKHYDREPQIKMLLVVLALSICFWPLFLLVFLSDMLEDYGSPLGRVGSFVARKAAGK